MNGMKTQRSIRALSLESFMEIELDWNSGTPFGLKVVWLLYRSRPDCSSPPAKRFMPASSVTSCLFVSVLLTMNACCVAMSAGFGLLASPPFFARKRSGWASIK